MRNPRLLYLCKNAWKITDSRYKIGTSVVLAEIKKLLRPYSPDDMEELVDLFATYENQMFDIDFDNPDTTQYAHGVMSIMASVKMSDMKEAFGSIEWDNTSNDHANNILRNNYDNVGRTISMNESNSSGRISDLARRAYDIIDDNISSSKSVVVTKLRNFLRVSGIGESNSGDFFDLVSTLDKDKSHAWVLTTHSLNIDNESEILYQLLIKLSEDDLKAMFGNE